MPSTAAIRSPPNNALAICILHRTLKRFADECAVGNGLNTPVTMFFPIAPALVCAVRRWNTANANAILNTPKRARAENHPAAGTQGCGPDAGHEVPDGRSTKVRSYRRRTGRRRLGAPAAPLCLQRVLIVKKQPAGERVVARKNADPVAVKLPEVKAGHVGDLSTSRQSPRPRCLSPWR